MGTLLAALNIKYRDFRYVIPFFIQALLFATPVIYPIRIANSSILQYILMLNPMTAPIELFRSSFNNHPVDLTAVAISAGVSITILLFGLFYFRKTEAFFADLA